MLGGMRDNRSTTSTSTSWAGIDCAWRSVDFRYRLRFRCLDVRYWSGTWVHLERVRGGGNLVRRDGLNLNVIHVPLRRLPYHDRDLSHHAGVVVEPAVATAKFMEWRHADLESDRPAHARRDGGGSALDRCLR